MSNLKKVGVISLGCDKNRVDTEKMLAVLSAKYELTHNIEQAEIVIVNTCAFLESARQEAIEEILAVSEYKKTGVLKKLVVTGCLPQKFINELFDELYEVDAFLGVSDYKNLLQVLDKIESGVRVNAVGETKNESIDGRVLTTDGYAYLKIADGCFNRCTYCLIPYIRGKYRSVKKEELLSEVKALGLVNELILVAQDTLKYGVDIYENYGIVELIQDISKIETVKSIRLLYCYPEHITDELIEEFLSNDKLIKYVDMPMQHANDFILKRMARRGRRNEYIALIKKLRDKVKGISLRSTFIAGFPGEDDEKFNDLLEFIKEVELDNAGFFKYSREYGTPAYDFDGQVKNVDKYNRVRKLYSAQRKVSKKLLKKRKGTTLKVIAEYFDEDRLCYVGRAYFQAPSVDGKVYFLSADEVKFGEYYEVLITDTDSYDLFGERV